MASCISLYNEMLLLPPSSPAGVAVQLLLELLQAGHGPVLVLPALLHLLNARAAHRLQVVLAGIKQPSVQPEGSSSSKSATAGEQVPQLQSFHACKSSSQSSSSPVSSLRHHQQQQVSDSRSAGTPTAQVLELLLLLLSSSAPHHRAAPNTSQQLSSAVLCCAVLQRCTQQQQVRCAAPEVSHAHLNDGLQRCLAAS
jgi:hypothetical protein